MASVPIEPPGEVLPGRDPFVGLGAWLDIFEKAYETPGATVERMAARGVKTIYLQSSNFTRPGIQYPGRFGAFIDAAHAHDIAVVGWYLPGLKDMPEDLRKSLTAIRYVSPRGHSLDGFGVDIESAEVRRHKIRSERLVMHSRQLRAKVGPTYPLGAITPMPTRLAMEVTYWHDFPYEELTEYYDAIVPMHYFTYDGQGEEAAWRQTTRAVDLIRRGTGDPSFPIHVIGGISGAMSPEETKGFMDAVRETGVVGWSVYNYSLTPNWMWAKLQPV